MGIGRGMPSDEADVRLDDVVVSKPHKTHSGVVQYDTDKATVSGFERSRALNTPPTVLLNAMANVQMKQMRGKSTCRTLIACPTSLEAARSEIFFETKYKHAEKEATCAKCSTEHAVDREPRRQEVVVHYRTIASSNQIIKNAAIREKISIELGGVLCFEIEALELISFESKLY